MYTIFSSWGTQPCGPVAKVCYYLVYFNFIRLTLNIGKVQTHYLCLTEAQQEAIKIQDCTTWMQYHFDTRNQTTMHEFLMQHGLNQVSCTSLDSHWNAQWSSSWSIQDGEDYRRWTLYQWYILNCWHVIVNGMIYVL